MSKVVEVADRFVALNILRGKVVKVQEKLFETEEALVDFDALDSAFEVIETEMKELNKYVIENNLKQVVGGLVASCSAFEEEALVEFEEELERFDMNKGMELKIKGTELKIEEV